MWLKFVYTPQNVYAFYKYIRMHMRLRIAQSHQ